MTVKRREPVISPISSPVCSIAASAQKFSFENMSDSDDRFMTDAGAEKETTDSLYLLKHDAVRKF